jgi:glycosyltransferase involved in cell wall biosynthesis
MKKQLEDMNNSKISVVIPIYNAERYLDRCLSSVVSQSHDNLEIICVNDGSSDNSASIIESYVASDSRIRVITQENAGLSSARNRGLQIATGDYVGFVDSDDWIDRDTYRQAASRFASDEALDIICWGARVVAADGYVENVENSRKYHQINLVGKHEINRDTVLKVPVTAWNKLYKNQIIARHGLRFPDGLLYEDNVFFWQYIVRCRHLFYIDQYLYNYNRRPNSIMGLSNSRESTRLYDRLDGFRVILETLGGHAFFVSNPDLIEIVFFRSYTQEMINSALPEKVFEHALEIMHFIPLQSDKQRMEKKISHEFFSRVRQALESRSDSANAKRAIRVYPDRIATSLTELGEFQFLPNLGNLGDAIIALSEYQMFRNLGCPFNVMQESITDLSIDKSFNLVYGGGGLFVKYWNYEKVMKVFRDAPLDRVIILPSSFFECDDLLNVLDERFLVFCREEKSLNYCRSVNSRATFRLESDIAFSVDLAADERPPTERFAGLRDEDLSRLYYGNYQRLKRLVSLITWRLSDTVMVNDAGEKIAFFLRTDKESRIGDLTYDVIDLSSFAKTYCTDSGMVNCLAKIFTRAIDSVDIVITDRLHVGITAALLQKKVVLLDNVYGKVSGVFSHSMRNMENVRLLQKMDELDASITTAAGAEVEFHSGLSFADFVWDYFAYKDELAIVDGTVWE